ncbi:hypothetical protein Tco_0747341 [Tanacetum coccineum]|uniref:Uncharacterized protein n=1 Tax=Tanacetum coccineum TaxID=301880 RepID=A0ABQ4YUY6_9ASTR
MNDIPLLYGIGIQRMVFTNIVRMSSKFSNSLVICASATYPPLDDCQLWETLGSTISVSMKDMNTSLWNWNSTYGFYQYCPMASIVSYSLVICASAWYLNNGSIEYHENSFLIIYSLDTVNERVHMTNTLGAYFVATYYFTVTSSVADWAEIRMVTRKRPNGQDSWYSMSPVSLRPFGVIWALKRAFFYFKLYFGQNQLCFVCDFVSFLFRTYPPLDDCQLWETLGSTISVSMKDMNTSLSGIWNSNVWFFPILSYGIYSSYSLVICASAWYLNNGSIEYHENSFLIIYSLGKFFKGAHSFGLASCCTPCVSNVSSLTYPPLDDCQLWETLGSTISVSMKDMNTSLWNWNSTYGFYQYCPMASIVSYSLVICASATYPPLDDCQLWETLGSTISVSMKDMNTSIWNWNSTTYPPLDDCQLWETLGSTISVSMKDMNTSIWNWNSTTYPPLDDCQLWETLGSTISVSMKDMNTSIWNWNSTTYPPLDDCQLWETLGSTISVSMKDMNTSIWNWNSTTYPPLDDCQLWETLGSTISVSMKDMNTSLWNWNSTYGFYQYCPMASIVSYSLVICASAWYLNNGSIEYHENSFLIIYSLGKFFKGAHSFGLASCCTPCVSNVSSLWSVMLS